MASKSKTLAELLNGDVTIDATDIAAGSVTSAKLATQTGNVDFADNAQIRLGDSQDLQLYHDGSNSFLVDNGTGGLQLRGSTFVALQGTNGENGVLVTENGSAQLRFNNSPKLETTGTGVSITGDIVATGTTGGVSKLRLAAEEVHGEIEGINIGNNFGGLAFKTNNNGTTAEVMRIDSSGNVGIGATPESTFAQKRVLRLSTTASLIAGGAYYPYPYYVANNLYYDSSDNLKYIASSGGALLDINAHLGGRFTFYTAPAGTAGATASITERMRISSNGQVKINSSDVSDAQVNIRNDEAGGLYRCLNLYTGVTSNRIVQTFFNGNGQVGQIVTNGSATAYQTSSDYRLKENVTADWDATTRLKQLNPVRFNFIADADTTVDGFLAHEVQDIVPEAISGTKDGMVDEEYEVSAATGDIYTPAVEATYDDDGVDEVIHSADVERPEELEEGQQWRETTAAVMGTRSVPDYQGIDQGKLVPLLVKSLQEALTKIETLESRLNDAGL